MRRPVHLALAALALALALASPAHAGGARILEAPGLPPFTNLQQAIDAAADGDTILIGTGSYAGAKIVGKGVSLVTAPGQSVHIQGTLEVIGLPASSHVLLSALSVVGVQQWPTSQPALILTNCAGHVRVEACTFIGGNGDHIPFSTTYGAGAHAVVVQASPRVAFSRCVIQGGSGAGDVNGCVGCTGGKGGSGMRLNLSTPAIYDCNIAGGDGGANLSTGGEGGHGTWLLNSWLIATGSSFEGGAGGMATDFIFANGGDGGVGLVVAPGASAALQQNTFSGGPGGSSAAGSAFAGHAGNPKGGGGIFVEFAGKARKVVATRVVVDDQQEIQVQVLGAPGDQVWVQIGKQPAFVPFASVPGVRLVKPGHLKTPPLGTIGAAGILNLSFPAPDLVHEPGRLLHVQTFGRDALGQAWLSGFSETLVINRLGPPDCNGNGVNDLVDAFSEPSSDCDKNLQPDTCDPDCNGNGQSDGCDILSGTAADCNGNEVPDSCDIAGGFEQDCNGNSVPDSCDVSSGTSSDANDNGIPDECEPGTTWWVDASAPAGGNGSMAAPFRAISEGVQASIDGDEVIVRDGVYTGLANRDIEFEGKTITVRSQNGPLSCTIDAQSMGRAFLILGSGPGTLIDGITFVGGWASEGGAIYSVSSYVVVRNCRFEANSAIRGAAVGFGLGGGALVQDCLFLNNATSLAGIGNNLNVGAGIMVYGGPAPQDPIRILRCTFVGNAAESGGAIHGQTSRPITISHCTFRENSAILGGGAIHNRSPGALGGVMTVDNCLFAGNVAGESGGAILSITDFVGSLTELHVGNSTFSHNQAGVSGGSIMQRMGGSIRIRNSVAWGDSAPLGGALAMNDLGLPAGGVPTFVVDRCDIQGGAAGVGQVGQGLLQWGAGNLDLDPQFADPDGPDNDPATTADNDYRPSAGSPVNDAGDNALVLPDANDVDGDGNTSEPTPLDLDLTPRLVDDLLAPDVGAGTPPLVDLGCYERP